VPSPRRKPLHQQVLQPQDSRDIPITCPRDFRRHIRRHILHIMVHRRTSLGIHLDLRWVVLGLRRQWDIICHRHGVVAHHTPATGQAIHLVFHL